MVTAIADVKDQNLTVTAAARKHNVPRKTLDDRIKGKVVHGTHPGVSTVLTAKEESALVSYLVYMANRGYPLTHTLTKAFAMAIAVRSGNEGRFGKDGPSEHWWTGFRQRHPEVTLRKPDKLERSRADALNPVVVKQYFELLEGILDKNGQKNSPRQLYNCDEAIQREGCDAERQQECIPAGTGNLGTHYYTLCCICCGAASTPNDYLFQVFPRWSVPL